MPEPYEGNNEQFIKEFINYRKEDDSTNTNEYSYMKSLEDLYESLQEEYKILNEKYESLKEEYEPLKEKYEALKEKYEPLKEKSIAKPRRFIPSFLGLW